MNEPRTRTDASPNDSQLRRAQRGVVASYIHSLSERHGPREGDESQPGRDRMSS